MTEQFRGVINLDVRDSTPDWEPFQPPQATADSPNVLYVVLDDTGFAAWDIYGGAIEMPNLKRIADRGLRYTNWHTTALCSPTRSSLLNGRNAHTNGMACIVEGASGYPGQSAVIPPEAAMISEVLVENGFNTYCVGKWHLTPENESNMAGSRRTWPLGRGFERYYGFLGGETNQWYPDLVHDNHAVDQPYSPEEGYHLSKDLVDQSIQYIQDGVQVAPDKPWLMYLSFGANHAPHHAPKEWIEKYQGSVRRGLRGLPRRDPRPAEEDGHRPEVDRAHRDQPVAGSRRGARDRPGAPVGLALRRREEALRPHGRGVRRVLDVHRPRAGRLLDYLEASGQLDNTIIVVVLRQRGERRGQPERLGQREQVLQRLAR